MAETNRILHPNYNRFTPEPQLKSELGKRTELHPNYNRFTKLQPIYKTNRTITTANYNPSPPGGGGRDQGEEREIGTRYPLSSHPPTHRAHPPRGEGCREGSVEGGHPLAPNPCSLQTTPVRWVTNPLCRCHTPDQPMAPRTLRLPDSLGKTRLNAKPAVLGLRP